MIITKSYFIFLSTILLVGCIFVPMAASAADFDSDGIRDETDNCMAVYNPAQSDGDIDGTGDACDADYNNDGLTDDTDTTLLRGAFNSSAGDAYYESTFDHNGDGSVDGADFLAHARLLASSSDSE